MKHWVNIEIDEADGAQEGSIRHGDGCHDCGMEDRQLEGWIETVDVTYTEDQSIEMESKWRAAELT